MPLGQARARLDGVNNPPLRRRTRSPLLRIRPVLRIRIDLLPISLGNRTTLAGAMPMLLGQPAHPAAGEATVVALRTAERRLGETGEVAAGDQEICLTKGTQSLCRPCDACGFALLPACHVVLLPCLTVVLMHFLPPTLLARPLHIFSSPACDPALLLPPDFDL